MQHMLASETTSAPVIHVHTVTAPYTTTDSNGDPLSLKTDLDAFTTGALTPCLTGVSDTKTFYSTVEVIDNPPSTTTTTAPAATITTAAAPTTMEENSGEVPHRRRRAASSVRSTDKPPSRRQSVTRSSTFSPSSTSQVHRNSLSMSQRKREDLLALHRDSCRLFQPTSDQVVVGAEHQPQAEQSQNFDQRVSFSRSNTAPVYASSRVSRSLSSKTASPITMSPALRAQRSPAFSAISQVYTDHGADDDISDDDILAGRSASLDEDPKKNHRYHQQPTVPATVMHWTSASTRRREYEKIDRNSRGIRGFWRKVAPKCFHPSTSRTPFFEEGKDGKGNYEGSVRRFRMDIPDEKGESTTTAGQYLSSSWWASKKTKLGCWS